MAHDLNTPQLAVPFALAGGEVALVEQDSATDQYQNAVTIMRYRRGERLALPEFGIPDPTFRENGVDDKELISSVLAFEPDVSVSVVKGIITEGTETADVTVSSNDIEDQ